MGVGATYRYLEFTFDEGRLERSKDIVCLPIDSEGQQLPESHYMCVGGDSGSEHYCHTRPFLDCDCHDFSWGNDRLCKHLIAALALEKDDLITEILGGNISPSKPTQVTVVCGPPASGKSTYVKNNAADGDFVWDMDKVASATVFNKTHATDGTQRILRAMRDAALKELDRVAQGGSGLDSAWIVWSLPKRDNRERLARRYKARIVVLECPVETCVEHAQADDRSHADIAQVQRAAQGWWEDYDPREEDEVIQWA